MVLLQPLPCTQRVPVDAQCRLGSECRHHSCTFIAASAVCKFPPAALFVQAAPRWQGNLHAFFVSASRWQTTFVTTAVATGHVHRACMHGNSPSAAHQAHPRHLRRRQAGRTAPAPGGPAPSELAPAKQCSRRCFYDGGRSLIVGSRSHHRTQLGL
jgi:hypothetical protein